MYKLIFIAGVFILTGCVVADMDSTNYAYPPYIQTFQNPATVGHTDVEQRRQDLYACGVEKRYPLDSNDKTWRRGMSYQGETLQDLLSRVKKIENCMKQKGYIIFGFSDCGPLKAPTGMCN